MKPQILSYGIALFIVFLFVHVVFWRLRLSRISSLLLIAIILLAPSGVFIIIISGVGDLSKYIALSSVEMLYVLILYISLSLVYVASYPAVQAVSPSLDIMLMIASSTERKMTGDNILRVYSDKKLVTARIDDLMMYNLLVEENNHVRLSPLAKLIIMGFIVYRKLLGLPVGRG